MSDLKTEIQLSIEGLVTNGRGYTPVPYTRILGDRLALKQWGSFSGEHRPFNPINDGNDKISLLDYLSARVRWKFEDLVKDYISAAYLLYTDKMNYIKGDKVLVVQEA